ncbi:MAG: hydroxymethylbilane synthase [Henriciella sp.]|nr:hydroxymethylbilane synthase [Henriciella sp.]
MASPEIIRIGTRGSPLALYQARLIAAALEAASNGALRGEIASFTTTGDQLTTERLIDSGGKGLFTREIDRAVDDGEVDIAVHSLKDVPTLLPDGQSILAYPERADPRDGFLSVGDTKCLADLPIGATLGTASLRRDLKIITFRGNVETRLEKLKNGFADATFLAMAGLSRLDLANVANPVPFEDMLPAAGQGIIAVAARPDTVSSLLLESLTIIDHTPTRCAATAERAFLTELDGSCRTAIAAHMRLEDGGWHLRGEVLAPDGQQRWFAEATALLSASQDELATLGHKLGQTIRNNAGGALPAYTDT